MALELKKVTFNLKELSGSFGDLGNDLPLIIALLIATGMYAPGVLIVFGIMQVATGLLYRMPMPVQPLKAMTAIVITQKLGGDVLLGAGLAIGVIMLLLTVSGALDILYRWMPKPVIRGIQFGLGISLSKIALVDYLPSNGIWGYVLAFIAFAIAVSLLDNRRFPASLLVILLGLVFALAFNIDWQKFDPTPSLQLPQIQIPKWVFIVKGFFVLTLTQLPLSLANSVLATKQVCNDLFPERTDITLSKIGYTYSIMNCIVPFLGGIPICHGSGGIVGHYTFGGRSGGSVILYGLFYILIGLFFGNSFSELLLLFPLPMLGVILFLEGISLMLLIKDCTRQKKGLVVTLIVGLIAANVPYGFLIALVLGCIIYYSGIPLKALQNIGNKKD